MGIVISVHFLRYKNFVLMRDKIMRRICDEGREFENALFSESNGN